MSFDDIRPLPNYPINIFAIKRTRRHHEQIRGYPCFASEFGEEGFGIGEDADVVAAECLAHLFGGDGLQLLVSDGMRIEINIRFV